ncbi:uncharacterized protein LOC122082159 [Macadamia integrifolia]|uniref:uncharacterized protein LOC122082159 n=1 Tax=Macadamia integrifolia TaxID=60698 RepID=UPI001C4E59C2|nr:uncharacterized protein LOC122082159 [Macadamia integrifolia]
MASPTHREAVLKSLASIQVPIGTDSAQLARLVGAAYVVNSLMFADADLPLKGSNHTRALHITIDCRGCRIPQVLVDNGSALNVFPLRTFKHLGFDEAEMKPSSQCVRAYDNTRRSVLGIFTVVIVVGPAEFEVDFQVIDIPASFNMILGRPWLHKAGAVSSSLDQKIKFLFKGQVITVLADPDLVSMMASVDVGESNNGETSEVRLGGFELGSINATLGPSSPRERFALTEFNITNPGVTNMLLKMKYFPGMGLGVRQQGDPDILSLNVNTQRFGLGYVMTEEDQQKIAAKKQKYDRNFKRYEGLKYKNEGKNLIHMLSNEESSEGKAIEAGYQQNKTIKYGLVKVSKWNNMEDGSETVNVTPYFKTLNGYFVKEGQDFFYCGFPEPWLDVFSGERLPGFEIFFDCAINWAELEHYSLKQFEQVQQGHTEEDLDVSGLFDEEIMMIGGTNESKAPSPHLLIHRAEGVIPNWSCLDEFVYPEEPKFVPEESAMSGPKSFKFVGSPLVVSPFVSLHVGEAVPTKDSAHASGLDLMVKEEIAKQLSVGFIEVTRYTEWLANVVVVPKKDGRIRVCVDYRDINRASPKDNFPLPHIDLLVDNTAGHALLSFIDGFSGYNQIQMNPKDKDKTSFTTDWGTYKYRVMPFGLKNAGGLLLGFMVSERGIEIDPSKIKAITEMSPPQTEKEIRGFLGRIQYISRFISQLTAICEPIFKLLKKDQPKRWNPQCQLAFDRIKSYLVNPPILIPPTPGRPLLLYLSVLETSMGSMVAQHGLDGHTEQVIYYFSKKFTDCETRYTTLEKTCAALVWATRRLRHYMLTCSVFLVSRMDPIKCLFEKPALTGRLARWLLLLAEFDIVYVTYKSIKGSVIAEHLSAHPVVDTRPLNDIFPDDVVSVEVENVVGIWQMFFDGAANHKGCGAGVLLITLEGLNMPMAYRLDFECTNNMAEYEACLMGLKAAISIGVKRLEVYGDSSIVICQVQGKWKTKEEKLKPYQGCVESLMKQFTEINFDYFQRDNNRFADALATLASMVDFGPGEQIQPFIIDRRDHPSHQGFVNALTVDGRPWFAHIMDFIREGKYPADATQGDKRFLRCYAT